MQHAIGQTGDATQAVRLIQVATHDARAQGMQGRIAAARGAEHRKLHTPAEALGNTQANVATADDQQTLAAKARRQGAKRVLV